MLTTGSYFIKEKGFEELNPVYQVSSYDIQEYIKERLLESKSESEKGLWLHHAKGEMSFFLKRISIIIRNIHNIIFVFFGK